MLVVGSGLCQTGNDALYVQSEKIINGTGLILKTLVAVGTDDTVSCTASLILDTVENSSVIVGYQIRYNDANDLRSFFAQALGKGIRPIVQLFG